MFRFNRNLALLYLFPLLLPALLFGAEKFETFVEKSFHDLDMSPGMAVAVVSGEETIYLRSFGYADVEKKRPVTNETMFYIASSTKSFTAFTAALLAQQGRFDLDASVIRYLPDLKLHPELNHDSITIRDLLTHTHGIGNMGPVVFRTAFSGDFSNQLLLELMGYHPPAKSGRAYNYGNIGYNLAGLAMEAATGTSWKKLQQELLFDPLDMEHTSAWMSRVNPDLLALPYATDTAGFSAAYFAKGDENMHAAGGHVSSAADLARWLRLHINEGFIDGKRVFPAEVVRATHRQNAKQDRMFSEFHRFGWGLGWDLGTYESDTLIHRFGSFSGFRSHMSFMPQHKLGVVVLCNNDYLGSYLADFIAMYIYDSLLEKEGLEEKYAAKLQDLKETKEKVQQKLVEELTKRAARPQQLPHPLEAYTGTFANDVIGEMQWVLKNGKLEVTMGKMWSPVEVYDAGENQLRVELMGGGQVIAFQFENGTASGLKYLGFDFKRMD